MHITWYTSVIGSPDNSLKPFHIHDKMHIQFTIHVPGGHVTHLHADKQQKSRHEIKA